VNAVTFGSLFQFIRNGMNVKQDKSGNGLPITRIETISDATVDGSRVGFAGLAENECREWLLEPGDILFSHINSVEHIGKCAVYRGEPQKLVHGMNLLCLRSDTTKLLPEFAKYLIRGNEFRQRLGSFINKAVNQASVSIGNMKTILVTVPPLAEQRRIAEILDKADALRAKRRAALAQLDTLIQSIFLDMFGDPATNPRGWPVKRIEDLAECLDRLRRPVTESDRKPGDVPYYGANGQQGWIDTALFDEPLILVAEDGGFFDAPERGVAYRIDGRAWVNNHAHILRANQEYVDTEFLHRALRHFNFLPYISGTTRAKLTQGQLNAVKLFVPPLDLQCRFGEQVAHVQSIARETSSSRNQLDALFVSLQHRAFRGEL
jgi:type I restriction enzyme, S subunit